MSLIGAKKDVPDGPVEDGDAVDGWLVVRSKDGVTDGLDDGTVDEGRADDSAVGSDDGVTDGLDDGTVDEGRADDSAVGSDDEVTDGLDDGTVDEGRADDSAVGSDRLKVGVRVGG